MPDIQNETAAEVQAESRRVSDAVCIDTARVYDSCADRDCLANLRVTFTDEAQAVIDAATSVRCRSCEVINVFSEIEKVPFNTGYYSVDNTFYFQVGLDVYTAPTTTPQTVYGLCTASKKNILYGSEGSVKVFSSEYVGGIDEQLPAVSTNPRAKIQVATPICLEARLCTAADCCSVIPNGPSAIPAIVQQAFSGTFQETDETAPAVRVTLGLFSIVQLERDVQMLIPAYDFCMPDKECADSTEDPCDAFRRMDFPVNEFFPPEQADADNNAGTPYPGCGCGD
ncbi:MAG: hypothetical protein IJT27_00810 [Clostridia bacterium]|nr:hypothetical protein [Clostridia bacterium]